MQGSDSEYCAVWSLDKEPLNVLMSTDAFGTRMRLYTSVDYKGSIISGMYGLLQTCKVLNIPIFTSEDYEKINMLLDITGDVLHKTFLGDKFFVRRIHNHLSFRTPEHESKESYMSCSGLCYPEAVLSAYTLLEEYRGAERELSCEQLLIDYWILNYATIEEYASDFVKVWKSQEKSIDELLEFLSGR